MIDFMLIFGFFVGLMVGSFLNVVINRLPLTLAGTGISINNPQRSVCPKCGEVLSVWMLIPLFSFAILGGKCKHCHGKISWQYPAVEVASGLLAMWLISVQGFSILTAFYLLFAWGLLSLFVIDVKHKLLPDILTLPLLWLGLIFAIVDVNHSPDLASSVIGAVIGYLSLWGVFWLFKLLRGVEAMGYGDFKLSSALGAWLGWQMLPELFLLASTLGIIWFLVNNYKMQQKFAFGPFLIISALILLIFGQEISQFIDGLI